ncbi:unnamed protein product [Allacma fusca]|uniref:Uncharacterized protein n=1 Tax=Allacma fusca TaxID=39272 RepID=A0A8J2KWD2_9HEXA|nr:unnamed protein product [Allacma fusca]
MGPTVENKPGIFRISQPWLIDLEKSYELAFAHQFGFLNFEQNRRLIDTFGYASALNSTIQEMLVNPRARLYQFANHWGEIEEYHFLRKIPKFEYKGTQKINLSQKFLLKSRIHEMVKNPMVRLFTGENLTGDSHTI